MSGNVAPKIIYDSSLVLYLDAANINSYPGSGTTWTDLTINQNNVTNFVSSSGYNSSNGGAITFNGTNQYLNKPYSSSLSMPNSHSLECWFYNPLTPPFTYTTIIRGGASSDQQYCMFSNSSGGVNYQYWDTSLSDFVLKSSTTSFSRNTWSHCSMVKNGTSLSMYLNGILDSTHTVAITVPNSFGNLVIGGNPQNGSQWYSGSISNIKMYNRALSATEIQQNYNTLKRRFGL
jgi:hypothetical protein